MVLGVGIGRREIQGRPDNKATGGAGRSLANTAYGSFGAGLFRHYGRRRTLPARRHAQAGKPRDCLMKRHGASCNTVFSEHRET